MNKCYKCKNSHLNSEIAWHCTGNHCELEVREDERAKVLKAVIDCGWNSEVHSDEALYEMVKEQLKED